MMQSPPMTCRGLRILWVALATLVFALPSAPQTSSDPATLVDPLIGTANEGYTFPGAVVPFGMVTFSPNMLAASASVRNVPGGYLYAATPVRGFALTHLSGAGCAASGDVEFMPLTHPIGESPALNVRSPAYTSSFNHANEHAEAGFYRVRLDNGAEVKLTATPRTGAAVFTFPAGQDAVLLIRSADNDVGSTASLVRIDPRRRLVSGALTSGDFCWFGGPPENRPYYTLYFAARFDQPFADFGTWQDAAVRAGTNSAAGGTSFVNRHSSTYSVPGKGSGAYVQFANKSGSSVGMRVGVSFVSVANAEDNLQAENFGASNFDSVRAQAHALWTRALSSIRVSGGTQQQQTVFYTALYHAMLQMNLASDHSGEYRGMDMAVHRIRQPQQAQYANFSGWDQYRSQLQLLALLQPQVAGDMAQSLLNQADQLGCWSRWTHNTGPTGIMNGDPSAPAVAEIYAFGSRSFDFRAAYASLLHAATAPDESRGCPRKGLAEWMSLHYMAAHAGGHDTSVADTLEDATADFAVSQLAGELGDKTNQAVMLARAQNWKNLFNPHATATEGYLQPRNGDGSWRAFKPAQSDGFVEGSGAQYVWSVPFNEAALFGLMGGNAAACRRLDTFFHNPDGSWAFSTGGLHPGMDNEPSIETPWLYDFCGEPYRTQQTIAAIRDDMWTAQPGGIPGNDDLGEMSSWFVWSVLGLYPEIPSRADLVLTSPLFDHAVLHRRAGDIVIDVKRRSPTAIYIGSVERNGKPWRNDWLAPDFLHGPQHLVFMLQDQPDPHWGVESAQPPPSFDH